MSHLAQEIATQPTDWARAAGLIADRGPTAEGALPGSGERVAVIGCGTSYFIAQAYAAAREDAGHGVTDAFAASEHRLARGYDRALFISRSGTTTEVAQAIEESAGAPTTAIVADPDTPVAKRVDNLIALDWADEKSVVQTRFATTVLALLRAHLGDDLAPVIAHAREALAADVDPELIEADQVTFLGRGAAYGLAQEAALKLRESTQSWTESYPAMEYRHGPIAISTTGRVTWMFGSPPDGLAEDVAATGARFEYGGLDPLAELVRVHRLCLHKADQLGLDPDQPRHLSRSVILDG